ncbi:MAG: hypothetical protein SEPTF4163_001134 [Sporothrix epigloea]
MNNLLFDTPHLMDGAAPILDRFPVGAHNTDLNTLGNPSAPTQHHFTNQQPMAQQHPATQGPQMQPHMAQSLQTSQQVFPPQTIDAPAYRNHLSPLNQDEQSPTTSVPGPVAGPNTATPTQSVYGDASGISPNETLPITAGLDNRSPASQQPFTAVPTACLGCVSNPSIFSAFH